MTLKAHLINFTRLGFIIGCVYMIFIILTSVFGTGALVELGGTKWTGLAAYGLILLTPVLFAFNGLLFGMISFLPYKVIERMFARIAASN